MIQKDGEEITALYDGQLSVIQHREGYRFSLDALVLAHWCRRVRGRALEIGAGCGVISLSLGLFGALDEIVAVELQASLADRAQRGLEEARARLRAAITVICDRAQAVATMPEHRGGYGLVLSNPPYFQAGRGKTSPKGERRLARHDLALPLDELIDASRSLLRPKGQLALIYPANASVTLLSQMRRCGIEPRALRPVYPSPGQVAKLILVRGVKGAKVGFEVEPPLYLRRAGVVGNSADSYSDEIQKVMRGEW